MKLRYSYFYTTIVAALIILISACSSHETNLDNSEHTNEPETVDEREMIFCPQDAMQCPDGTYVSRTGPNCEFAPCKSK